LFKRLPTSNLNLFDCAIVIFIVLLFYDVR